MKTLTRTAVVKSDEPKIASRAARLLLEELIRELQLNGLNPEHYRGEVSITLVRKTA